MLVTARRHFTSVYDSEVNGIGTRVVYRFLPMKFVRSSIITATTIAIASY